jgi:hypothetical protein
MLPEGIAGLNLWTAAKRYSSRGQTNSTVEVIGCNKRSALNPINHPPARRADASDKKCSGKYCYKE